MVNKVVAKKISIRFEQLGAEQFNSKLPELQELLRVRFPAHQTPTIESYNIDVRNPNSLQIDKNGASELYMVSADSYHSLQIGNQGFDYSTHRYVAYETQKEMFLFVLEAIQHVMQVKFVGHLSMRNINLFALNDDGVATDINTDSPFNISDNTGIESWAQVGAATRRDFSMENGLLGMAVNSSIAQQGQSYIPQPEWHSWQMAGGIPAVLKKSLLLMILVAHNQKENALQPGANTLVDLDINDISEKLDHIRNLLNQTYNSITKES
ncbi:TPA: TIGR04255 family protein [Vibrio campbellii]